MKALEIILKIGSLVVMVLMATYGSVLAGEASFEETGDRAICVGLGTFVKMEPPRSVVYRISRSAKGDLPVGESVNIQFFERTWTNNANAFPAEAVLFLEPALDINALFSGQTNCNLRTDYTLPGGDARKCILLFTGEAQLSNILCNVKDYISTPTNQWLATQAAVEIAWTYLKAYPPASGYDRKTRYFLRRDPVRYCFGWRITYEIENGFVDARCGDLLVGDDKQVKSIGMMW